MVTHDLLGAADIADRIGFLAEGLLSEEIHTRSGARIDVRDLHHRYALAGEAHEHAAALCIFCGNTYCARGVAPLKRTRVA